MRPAWKRSRRSFAKIEAASALPIWRVSPLIPYAGLSFPSGSLQTRSAWNTQSWWARRALPACRLKWALEVHGRTLCGAGQGKQGDAIGPRAGLNNNAQAPKDGALCYPCCLLLCKQRLWSRRPHYMDQKDRWAGKDDLYKLAKSTAIVLHAHKGMPMQVDENHIARCGALMVAKNALSNTGGSI